jgi:spermidine synthase
LAVFGYRRGRLAIASVASTLAILPVLFFQFDPNLISAGLFRRTSAYDANPVVTVRDGKTATISLHEIGSVKQIRTNGKTDAAVGGTKDEDVQSAAAFLPMAMIDVPYDAAVIGLGSGMTAHHLLGDPLLKSLDLIEIEQEVYEVAKKMQPTNRRVYESDRINLVIEDARTWFSTTRRQYDLIISEPSNPWVSGISSLFTREFYAHTKGFLKQDGLLVQWIHLREFNSELMLTIVNALDEAFPYTKIYFTPFTDNVLIVASQSEFYAGHYDRFRNSAEITSDLKARNLPLKYFGNRNYIASTLTLRALMQNAAVNSDYVPLVDNGAEKAFYLNTKVDLFVPFTNCLLCYQDLFEGEYFSRIVQERNEYFVDFQVDKRISQRLLTRLEHAGSNSDWVELERLLHHIVPDFLVRALWNQNEAVGLFRQHVKEGTPPELTRLKFIFKDNLAHDDLLANRAVIRALLDTAGPEDLKVTLIRTMAINAALLNDRLLFDRVKRQLVDGNPRMTEVDRVLLTSLGNERP